MAKAYRHVIKYTDSFKYESSQTNHYALSVAHVLHMCVRETERVSERETYFESKGITYGV